ncbi:HNH endonuclease [Catellatospora sichuanensis]|uniref:HNH endonuclease n=1 Tax=Catellatospora sichuanensis TaxID=1969805 RepID=UPI00118403B9|nr:HNH endonuclease [Catellatospora sichuanensis]
MALRSYSDVPNRVVRLFLEQAGRQYDQNRGLPLFGSMPTSLLSRFGNSCAYCGDAAALVAEHVVPINRTAVGLHAWGNIVPACEPCNKVKAGNPWEGHPRLDGPRRSAIAAYIAEYRYKPDVTELRIVVEKLYELADTQTRALIDFGLVASRPHIAGLHTPPPTDLVTPRRELDQVVAGPTDSATR